MGRRRRHGHVHYGEHIWQSWPEGQPRYRHTGIASGFWDIRQIDKWRRQVSDIPNQPKVGLFKRSSLKHTEPFAPTFVLDALLRTDPKGAFTAGELARHMNDRYPFWFATDVTIGKTMAMLQSEAVDQPRGPYHAPPIDIIKSGGTTLYEIEPDNASWGWLGHLREWWGCEAERWIREFDRTGRYPDENPWDTFTDWLAENPIAWGTVPEPPARVPRRRRRIAD